MDLLSGCSYIPAYVSSSIRLTGFWQSSALYLDTTCEDSETAGSDCEPLDWFKEMEVLQTSPCGIPETFKTPRSHAGTPKFPDPFGTLWDPPQRKRNLQNTNETTKLNVRSTLNRLTGGDLQSWQILAVSSCGLLNWPPDWSCWDGSC